ncbi:MAG TPA: tetratricopeptide repeat protein [Candidatus Wallbacteria bacterium]|nr:tetratricopeptide repeat protein [Candidatus Wallbacteria bacterium]
MNLRYFKITLLTLLLTLSTFYFSNCAFASSGDEPAPGSAEKLLGEIQKIGWEGKHGRAIKAYIKFLKDEPKNIEAMLGLAQNYEWAKKFEKAHATYSDVLRLSPQNITAAIGLARILYFQGELTPAAKNFKDIVEKNPENIEAQLAFAQYLGWRKKFNEAGRIYRSVLKKEPKNIEAETGLGRLAMWQENYEEAISIFRNVTAISGVDAFEARLELARAYFLKGDIEHAKSIYANLAEEKPENNEVARATNDLTAAVIEKARSYSAGNKLLEARKEYEKIIDFAPENFELLKRYGINEIDLGSVECGIKYLKKAIVVKDDELESYFALGAGYEKIQKYADAVETYERAIKTAPSSVEARLRLANACFMKNDPIRSLEIINSLLKENHEDRRARFLKSKLDNHFGYLETAEDELGILIAQDKENTEYKDELNKITIYRIKAAGNLMLSKKIEDAYAHYERILKHQPDHVEALMGKANIASVRRDYDGAIEIYRKVTGLAPNYVQAELDIALNLSWKKEYFAAISEYRKILKKYPENVNAIVGIARTYSWAGELDKAARHYREALKKDPENEEGLMGYANTLHWCGLDRNAGALIKTLRGLQGPKSETDELEKQIKLDHLRDLTASYEKSWDSDKTTLSARGVEFQADIDLSSRLRVFHKLFETWTQGLENLSRLELTSLNVSKILNENLRIFGSADFYGFEDRNKVSDSNAAGTLGAIYKKFNRYIIYLTVNKSILFDTPQLVSNKISVTSKSMDFEYDFSSRVKGLASLATADYSDKNKKTAAALTLDVLTLDRELWRIFTGPAYKSTSFSERKFNGYFSPTDYVTTGAYYRLEFKNRPGNFYLTWRDEYGRQKIERQAAEKYRNYNAGLTYIMTDFFRLEAAYTHGNTIGAAAAATGGYAFDYYSFKVVYRF